MSTHRYSQAGLTLLEVLITLVVTVVMAGYALPQWQGLIARNHVTATANELLGAVQFARANAIAQHRNVVLCPHNGEQRCATTADDWPFGYVLFFHDQSDPPYQPASPDHLLAVKTLPAGVRVLSNRTAFVFRPLSLNATNGTLRLCHKRDLAPPRALVVSTTGRPRLAPRLPSGATIPCPSTDGP